MLPSFVINLEKDAERREDIGRQLDEVGIDYEIIKAVDGRVISKEELASHVDKERSLMYRMLAPAEIGCSLSHRLVYKTIIDRNLPLALILEDDAQLIRKDSVDPEKDKRVLLNALNEITQLLDTNKPQLVLLSYVLNSSSLFTTKLANGYRLAATGKDTFLGHAYIVTLAAAKSLYHNIYPFFLTNDHWASYQNFGFIQVKAVVPYLIGSSDFSNESRIKDQRDIMEFPKNRIRVRFPLLRRLKNRLIKIFAFRQERVW